MPAKRCLSMWMSIHSTPRRSGRVSWIWASLARCNMNRTLGLMKWAGSLMCSNGNSPAWRRVMERSFACNAMARARTD
eukprot:5855636-Lingulodinium_polyedra.AAC.1